MHRAKSLSVAAADVIEKKREMVAIHKHVMSVSHTFNLLQEKIVRISDVISGYNKRKRQGKSFKCKALTNKGFWCVLSLVVSGLSKNFMHLVN